jgi:hypothetical protein
MSSRIVIFSQIGGTAGAAARSLDQMGTPNLHEKA